MFRTTFCLNASASPGAAEARDPKYTASVLSSLQAHAGGETPSVKASSAEPPSFATVASSKYVAQEVFRAGGAPPPPASLAARARSVSTSNTISTRVRSSATAADAATGAGRRTSSRRNGAPCASVPKTRGASQYVPTSEREYVARAVARLDPLALMSSVTSSVDANNSPAPKARPPESTSGFVPNASIDLKISNVSALASAAPSTTSLP